MKFKKSEDSETSKNIASEFPERLSTLKIEKSKSTDNWTVPTDVTCKNLHIRTVKFGEIRPERGGGIQNFE